MSNTDIPNCNCPNRKAVLRCTKKPGANLNRKFWGCDVRKEQGGCGFFQWAEEPAELEQPQPQKRASPYSPNIPPPSKREETSPVELNDGHASLTLAVNTTQLCRQAIENNTKAMEMLCSVTKDCMGEMKNVIEMLLKEVALNRKQ